jgi:Tho complex subunit 7
MIPGILTSLINRPLKRLFKARKGPNFMIEWQSLKFQFEKHIAVQKMAERQQKELEREMEMLQEEIVNSAKEIVNLKSQLEIGQSKVEMQAEYDKMAKEILKVPSRSKSQKYSSPDTV